MKRALSLLLLCLALGLPVAAAPAVPVVAVVGTGGPGRELDAMADGARIAAAAVGWKVQVFDDRGTGAGARAALDAAKRSKPIAMVAAPRGPLLKLYWKTARKARTPVLFLTGVGPDLTRHRGNVFHLGPSPTAEAIQAADLLAAPLSARRLGIVHEDSAWGRALAAGVERNLSRFVRRGGMWTWPGGADAAAKAVLAIESFEADWVYVALRGAACDTLVAALETKGRGPRLLFADGNRRASLVALGPKTLEGSAFLDGPDPELAGRPGEAFMDALDRAGRPYDVLAVRAFEAVRRVAVAAKAAESTKGGKVVEALRKTDLGAGTLGAKAWDEHGAIRLYPMALWILRGGFLDPWPEARQPCAGCGPPLGFGRPGPASTNPKKGHYGWMTYGEGEERTIESDLLRLGLSTDGKDPDLDQIVRDEILGRAIRIAHRLFRREADGTPIAGWSWGMTFTAEKPGDGVSRSRVWKALVAGDHEAAGGQVISDGLIATYSTFLVRTMYEQHKLEPPLSRADRPFLDGTWRWEDDPGLRKRADEIRCLMDGLASAMGLTTTHEFGHLAGCGHDTEHPTSIMNVVAGAGATWASAVWIPRHRKSLDQCLGVEGGR